jgi:hypothetical protein
VEVKRKNEEVIKIFANEQARGNPSTLNRTRSEHTDERRKVEVMICSASTSDSLGSCAMGGQLMTGMSYNLGSSDS